MHTNLIVSNFVPRYAPRVCSFHSYSFISTYEYKTVCSSLLVKWLQLTVLPCALLQVTDLLSGLGRLTDDTDEDDLEKELRDLLSPERKTTKPLPSSKNPSQISEAKLEAELAALSIDSLVLPEVPESTVTAQKKIKSQPTA